MATKDVTVKCSKETYELGAGLATFLGKVKQALDDGWQVGSDLPVIITAAVGDLVPAIQGIDAVAAEIAADKVAFANACALTGTAIVGALTK